MAAGALALTSWHRACAVSALPSSFNKLHRPSPVRAGAAVTCRLLQITCYIMTCKAWATAVWRKSHGLQHRARPKNLICYSVLPLLAVLATTLLCIVWLTMLLAYIHQHTYISLHSSSSQQVYCQLKVDKANLHQLLKGSAPDPSGSTCGLWACHP